MSICQGCGTEFTRRSNRGRQPKWCCDRCRKRTLYSGTCASCGGRTQGTASGRDRASVVCRSCSDEPIWTRENIIAALHRWADEHGGIPPRSLDWGNGPGGHATPGFPHAHSVARAFGTFNKGLVAAGYEPHRERDPHRFDNWAAIEAQLRTACTADVAAALGVSADNLLTACTNRGVSLRELRSAA